MTNANTNVIAKVAAVVAVLGLVAMSFASAAKAAETMTTTTTTTTTAPVFTMNQTIGSHGSEVMALQTWLIKNGNVIPAGATGYFGAQTKAALASYQTAKGIVPAVGYFGPITRASIAAQGGVMTSTTPGCVAGAMYSATTGAMCATTTTTVPGCAVGAMYSATTGAACGSTTTTTTTVSGTVGRLTNLSSLGDTTSDIKEGNSMTKLVGVSAEATDGDVSIQRVDASFSIGATSTASSNLDKYFSTVAVYLDGTKLGSMDPASGDKNGRVWSFRFSGLNGIIKKGMTGNIYVEGTPVSSIGSSESNAPITVTIASDGIRAVGSDGISETYGIANGTGNTVTVSTATTGTLTVTAGSDNPKASQIAVSSSTTSGVTLLTFNMKAKNADVKVTDLVASFGTSDNNLSDVVQTVKLMQGSTVLKSKTLGSGTYGTVTFDRVDQTISKDSTANYSIVADLKGDGIGSTGYPDGTTLIASTTVTGWDVSDVNGDTVSPSAVALGNTMTLTATGISVAKGSITTSTTVGLTGTGDSTQYSIPFTVTAGDNDVFVGGTVSTAVTYATTTSSTAASTGAGTTNFAASDSISGDIAGTAYKVPAGTSRTFTLNVTYVATSTGYTGVVLTGIKYGATSGAITSTYTSNLDTFKTTDVFMKVR